MEGLKRFYNQNRKAIWLTIGIIVFIIITIQMLEYWTKNRKNNYVNNSNNNISEEKPNEYNDVYIESNESVISGDKVSSKKIKDEVKIIDKFFTYCNNNEIDKAYELLTDECKEEMFPTVQKFEQLYFKKIFSNGKATASIEFLNGRTYKVNIREDALSTGKFEETALQDYITIKNVDDKEKININRYIGRTVLNKSKTQGNITIEVLERNRYTDYETYKIKVKNDLDLDILLDYLANTDSMYLEDSNGLKYNAYTNELSMVEVMVYKKQEKEITIKFASKYTSTKEIKKIVFSDVEPFKETEGTNIENDTDDNIQDSYKFEISID